MRTLAALLFVCACASSARAGRRSPLEFLDVLSPEVAGRVAGNQTVDLRRGDDFIGTTTIPGRTFVGGGIGLRLVLRFDWGLRFSVELGGTWGRLQEPPPQFVATSIGSRVEALSSVGYEVPLGKIATIHTATVIGIDWSQYDATLREGAALLAPGGGVVAPRGTGSVVVRDLGMRLGQQIGAHIMVYKALGFFGDATFDYDGQYRVRFGLAFGQVRTFR